MKTDIQFRKSFYFEISNKSKKYEKESLGGSTRCRALCYLVQQQSSALIRLQQANSSNADLSKVVAWKVATV